MRKLNFIQAGLRPSWITVAGPDPASACAHEYSCLVFTLGWDMGDLEPSSRFAINPHLPQSLIWSDSLFLFTLKNNLKKC